MSTASNVSTGASKGLTAGSHLKELHSLQKLTAECIWEHQIKFDHPNLDVNIFRFIPKPLRGYLLEEFIPLVNNGHHSYDEYDAVCRLLTRLLCENLTELDWPIKNLRLTPEVTLNLWECLLEKCRPHLQAINYSNSDSYYATSLLGVEDRRYIETFIIKMYPHLQVVRLHGVRFVMNDDQLCLIAHTMPNLRVLEVSRLHVRESADGFGALSNLQHFEEFSFAIQKYDVQKFKQLILQRLPKLCYVETLPDLNSDYGFNYQRMYSSSKPVSLGLQEVELCGAKSLPDGISLPNLKTLKLVTPHKNFQFDPCDLRLSKVSELVLIHASKDVYTNLLGQLGRQLNKLKIKVRSPIPLGQIFNLCPNLEFFSYTQNLSRTSSVSPIKLDTLHKLKELQLYTVDGVSSWDHQVVAAYSGVLLQLLQAPELQKLKLRCLVVEESEMAEIVRRLQQRKILQKLQTVEIEPLSQNDSTPLYWYEHHYVDLLLREIADNCPNLHRDLNVNM